MTIEYEWLTVERAVKELGRGRAVILVSTKNPEVELKIEAVEELDEWLLEWFRIRKPLTPEQIIAAGTPLLAEIVINLQWEGYQPIKCECPSHSGYWLTITDRAVSKDDVERFVTNTAGNYITIKEGIAEEVLR